MVEPLSLNFRVFTLKLVGVHKFRNFTCLEFGYLQMLTRSSTLHNYIATLLQFLMLDVLLLLPNC